MAINTPYQINTLNISHSSYMYPLKATYTVSNLEDFYSSDQNINANFEFLGSAPIEIDNLDGVPIQYMFASVDISRLALKDLTGIGKNVSRRLRVY